MKFNTRPGSYPNFRDVGFAVEKHGNTDAGGAFGLGKGNLTCALLYHFLRCSRAWRLLPISSASNSWERPVLTDQRLICDHPRSVPCAALT